MRKPTVVTTTTSMPLCRKCSVALFDGFEDGERGQPAALDRVMAQLGLTVPVEAALPGAKPTKNAIARRLSSASSRTEREVRRTLLAVLHQVPGVFSGLTAEQLREAALEQREIAGPGAHVGYRTGAGGGVGVGLPGMPVAIAYPAGTAYTAAACAAGTGGDGSCAGSGSLPWASLPGVVQVPLAMPAELGAALHALEQRRADERRRAEAERVARDAERARREAAMMQQRAAERAAERAAKEAERARRDAERLQAQQRAQAERERLVAWREHRRVESECEAWLQRVVKV